MQPNDLRRRLLKSVSLLPFWGGRLAGVTASEGPLGPIAPSSMALEVVRLFNTLELTHKLKLGTYASKDDLMQSETIWKFQEWLGKNEGIMETELSKFYRSLDFESDGILPGWTLSIHKSPSYDAYLLTVVLSSDTDTGKRDVFASDDRGIIHQGQLSPLMLPAKYVPLREAFPDLAPLSPSQTNILLAKAGGFLKRIAYSGMRGDVLPVQNSCANHGCCPSGNCSSGQCFCFNCGYGGCAWCCTGSCSMCWWACGGRYCSCCV